MAAERNFSRTGLSSTQSGRHMSPPPSGFRQRPLGRASTFAEGPAFLKRSSSTISESLSETRKSLLSSTDDLLVPRVRNSEDLSGGDESSPWYSLPLILALLPAVGGLIFKDGSAIITDVTLLALAAVFMNWALRTPWDWYHAAQAPTSGELTPPSLGTPVDGEDNKPQLSESQIDQGDEPTKTEGRPHSPEHGPPGVGSPHRIAAERELRTYELVALFSCFTFPVLAAWLLHAIRSQLSRPSEGLVSNYNLTIFLLVSEIRPLSHLIKMIERRTLFLQRKIQPDLLQDHSRLNGSAISDLATRLEELEAHVADGIAASGKTEPERSELIAAKASAQAFSDIKKSVQPELDALNRAMRRYEKRATISAIQIEARLQDLESQLKDVVALAAAAHRSADHRSQHYLFILANWLSAVIVVPLQCYWSILSFTGKLLNLTVAIPRKYIRSARAAAFRENKAPRKSTTPRSRERDKRAKQQN